MLDFYVHIPNEVTLANRINRTDYLNEKDVLEMWVLNSLGKKNKQKKTLIHWS